MAAIMLFLLFMWIVLSFDEKDIKENEGAVTSALQPDGRAILTVTISGKTNQYSATVKHAGKQWRGRVNEIPEINCREQTRVELMCSLEASLLKWHRSKIRNYAVG